MSNIEILLENKKENLRLCSYHYSTNLGYNIEVLKIGVDTQIKATPPIPYNEIAPNIIFLSKESRYLRLKSTNISMDDVLVFTEWVNKASDLLQYIYEHYEDFLPQNENEIELHNDHL